MSITECALCRRAADSRSMLACESCSAPLCLDCARVSRGRCPECAEETPCYD